MFGRWEKQIMTDNDMIWVEVDIPTNTCTIHSNLDCMYSVEKKETDLKGLNEMKAEGGWYSFVSLEEAKDHCLKLKDEKGFKTIHWCC